MGLLDQFAKKTFAEEMPGIAGDAITWQDPPEIRLERVQSDGLLLVRRPEALSALPAPWRQARTYAEVMLEVKMAGDHIDIESSERALLRRQARQVQRVEEHRPAWPGDLLL